MSEQRRSVFITGGTGYMGRKLIPRLLERGHEVRALVRSGSEKKLPAECIPVLGNALDAASYADKIAPADTFVQLVGVAHPSPAKAEQFRKVDLISGLGAVAAAKAADIRHFVYLSVAHPAERLRSCHRGRWLACDYSAPLVRTGSGTPVALSSGPDVQTR